MRSFDPGACEVNIKKCVLVAGICELGFDYVEVTQKI